MVEAHLPDDRNIARTTSERLRESFLRDLLCDCLPLAHFDHVARRMAGASLSARQALLTSVIRSMIDQGLMVVGGIVGGSDERVDPWDMSSADAMARIHDWYVVHHDDRDWVFGIWFALTERGERAAQALETKKSEG